MKSNLARWTVDNIDTALAILLSTIAAIFGTFGFFQNALLPAVAATLALLSISIIRDRTARDSLIDETKKLEHAFSSVQAKPSADVFFTTITSEATFISKAQNEIWLIQETGAKVIEENLKPLESLVNRGGKVKIILASNDPTVIEFIALRNKNLIAADFVARMKAAKSTLESLRKAVEHASGELEVRYIKYPLDITTLLIDPEAAETNCREGLIRMVGFKNFFVDKRDFTVKYQSEPKTFEYFSQQFKEMWKLAKVPDKHT